MSDGIVTKITGTFLLLLILYAEGVSQETAVPPVRIMFYNVENLFDTKDDTLTDDNEFLPGGIRRWTLKRYFAKINSIYKVIVSAGEWQPPEIIGLCEVENRKVAEDIIFGTGLSRYDYGILHRDSPDPRGIDVCLLYLKERVKILDCHFLAPSGPAAETFSSREILYARCLTGNDTLHLFINHWPSRRGGVLAGEDQRIRIAEMIRHTSDSIALSDGNNAGIIVMGDFNSSPDDYDINLLTSGYVSGLSMINLAADVPEQNGSYRYRGTWEMIDQALVSGSLVYGNRKLITGPGMFRIFSPSFLLEKDPVYPGMKPFSTYNGYRYQGGFSDHLPVILELKVR